MKATVVIILAFVLLVMIIVGIEYIDSGKCEPNSFFATLYATLLGVLWAALIGYVVWYIQQCQDKRVARNRLNINLKDEIQDNRRTLVELINYLAQLEKWAITLESPNVCAKDLMICNDPEKGEHLKEIFPYHQASYTIDEAVSKGSMSLLTEKLQDMIRQLAYNYRELNHRIDYCEKSNSDLVYTTVLVRASQQKRKSLITYQAKSIIRFLRKPAEDLVILSNEILGLLEKNGS